MRLHHLVIALALVSASLAARADTFNFSFGDSSDSFSGSGRLTTGSLQAPGEYSIASVTGSATTSPNGPSLLIQSILVPGSFPTPSNGGTFPANDNVLFVTNEIGSLDGYGLAFILSDGTQINLYDPQGSAYDALLERANGSVVVADLPITITPLAPVPEPSSFLLLGTGLFGAVSAVRRRKA